MKKIITLALIAVIYCNNAFAQQSTNFLTPDFYTKYLLYKQELKKQPTSPGNDSLTILMELKIAQARLACRRAIKNDFDFAQMSEMFGDKSMFRSDIPWSGTAVDYWSEETKKNLALLDHINVLDKELMYNSEHPQSAFKFFNEQIDHRSLQYDSLHDGRVVIYLKKKITEYSPMQLMWISGIVESTDDELFATKNEKELVIQKLKLEKFEPFVQLANNFEDN